MILAPFAAYSASGKPAATPAPASTITSMPAFARLGMTMGTSATRRSPGYVSRGTPTIMNLPPYGPYGVTHTQHQRSKTNRPSCPSQSREFSLRGPRQEMNGFNRAARVVSKPATLGAIATQPLLLFSKEAHANEEYL